MWEWLVSPIDATRAHDVGWQLSWHARLMTVSWGVLVPSGIMAARFFKVLPGQDWPRETDNRAWWRSHLSAQYMSLALMIAGMWLILQSPATLSATSYLWVHHWLGWATLGLGSTQYFSGWLRGSKGGPTDRSLRGDHYDMTPRRILFERLHKTCGYCALCLAALAILTGLWQANAPHWMWIAILGWWITLIVAANQLKKRGMVVETYAAIWGNDPKHPGNRPPA